jgi:hypothetical protein
MEKYKECNKAVLDKTSPFYSTYMGIYGYRHKGEE